MSNNINSNYNNYTNLNVSSSAFNLHLNSSRAVELDDEEFEEEEEIKGPPPLPDLADNRTSYNSSASGSSGGGTNSHKKYARRNDRDAEFDFD